MKSRQILANSLHQLGITSLVRKLQRPGLNILMFHGFTNTTHDTLENTDNLHLHIDRFESLCAHLSQHYQVLPLAEAAARLQAGQPLPARSIVITLDDGLASNYHLAFPILQRYQLPATIFVATDFVTNRAWLWPDRLEYAVGRTVATSLTTNFLGKSQTWSMETPAQRIETIHRLGATIKAMPQELVLDAVSEIESTLACALGQDPAPPAIYEPLTWEQIRTMEASGLITIGAHTHRHLILSRCSDATAQSEMATSCALLAKHLGHPVSLFAYPNGQSDDYIKATGALLAEFGITVAVTTVPGCNRALPDSMSLTLRRFGQPESPAHLDLLLTNPLRFLKENSRKPIGIAAAISLIGATLLLLLTADFEPPAQPPAHINSAATHHEDDGVTATSELKPASRHP